MRPLGSGDIRTESRTGTGYDSGHRRMGGGILLHGAKARIWAAAIDHGRPMATSFWESKGIDWKECQIEAAPLPFEHDGILQGLAVFHQTKPRIHRGRVEDPGGKQRFRIVQVAYIRSVIRGKKGLRRLEVPFSALRDLIPLFPQKPHADRKKAGINRSCQGTRLRLFVPGMKDGRASTCGILRNHGTVGPFGKPGSGPLKEGPR